jgi:Flp pilus assembly protein TadG
MKHRRIHELRTCRKGSTAIEFAIVTVALLTLVFAVIEFGRMLWIREALQAVATQGARCIGITASYCASAGSYNAANAQTYIVNLANSWGVTLTSGNLTLTQSASSGACSGTGLSVAKVTITYTFHTTVSSLLPTLASQSLTGQACYPKQTSGSSG